MAKCGSLLCFHGAFNKKSAAERKEARTPGSFIKFVLYKTGARFVVFTRKRRRKR